MTAAQQAHLRLLEQYKERTRTHERQLVTARGMKYTRQEAQNLRERLRQLESQGATREQMCRDAGTSSKTITRLLGRVGRKGRRRKCK